MYRFAALLVAVLACSGLTEALVTHPCANGAPHPSRVFLTGCTEMPCELIRGSDVGMELDFVAPFAASELRYEVHAFALGVTTEYALPGDRSNACMWLIGTSCPISNGEDITSTLSMPILPIYPLISLSIQVSVVIPNTTNILTCFAIDARVVVA